MRFLSVMLGLLCLPILFAALILSPVLLIPALFIPGFTAFKRTSSPTTWNIAAYHSPHSLTWSWILSIRRQPLFTFRPWSRFHTGHFPGFGAGIGQLLAFYAYKDNGGWQLGWSLLWHELHRSRQQPMWARDILNRQWDDQGTGQVNGIEKLAREEYREGVSPGAAARQLCRSLDRSSTLKRMLEDMLADANRASHDRYRILRAFEEVDPEAAQQARMASFRFINQMEDSPQQAPIVAATAAVH